MREDRFDAARRGRGVVSNPTGRFEPLIREPVADDAHDDEPPPLDTIVTAEHAASVISRNRSPDIGFDRSINPYRGCEHGCVYCYARPTHAYLGLSPGLDFESRLVAKVNAAEALERELRRPGYRPGLVMLGANTDAYQPIERRHRITRRVLEVLAACDHPVAITTKSALILRDLDLLSAMAERRLASVAVSVTTLDGGLARRMEPRASSPRRRLDAVRSLAAAGVPVSVLAAPMIPFVNDHELERIMAAGAAAGARAAGYTVLRLPLELKALFEEWLHRHLPDRAGRVLARLRDCHGGVLYDPSFTTRMKGSGPYAQLLRQRFDIACRRFGLASGTAAGADLDCGCFRPPPAAPDQLRLL
jgi:DNA repair photolyase